MAARQAKAQAKADQAAQVLAAARARRAEQERKRDQERESVIGRLDRAAADDRVAAAIITRLAEGRRRS